MHIWSLEGLAVLQALLKANAFQRELQVPLASKSIFKKIFWPFSLLKSHRITRPHDFQNKTKHYKNHQKTTKTPYKITPKISKTAQRLVPFDDLSARTHRRHGHRRGRLGGLGGGRSPLGTSGGLQKKQHGKDNNFLQGFYRGFIGVL